MLDTSASPITFTLDLAKLKQAFFCTAVAALSFEGAGVLWQAPSARRAMPLLEEVRFPQAGAPESAGSLFGESHIKRLRRQGSRARFSDDLQRGDAPGAKLFPVECKSGRGYPIPDGGRLPWGDLTDDF